AKSVLGRHGDLEADSLRHRGRTADGELAKRRGADGDAVLRPDDATGYRVDGLNELGTGTLQRRGERVNARVGCRERVVGGQARYRVAAVEGRRARVASGDVAEGVAGRQGKRLGDAGDRRGEAGNLERSGGRRRDRD